MFHIRYSMPSRYRNCPILSSSFWIKDVPKAEFVAAGLFICSDMDTILSRISTAVSFLWEISLASLEFILDLSRENFLSPSVDRVRDGGDPSAKRKI